MADKQSDKEYRKGERPQQQGRASSREQQGSSGAYGGQDYRQSQPYAQGSGFNAQRGQQQQYSGSGRGGSSGGQSSRPYQGSGGGYGQHQYGSQYGQQQQQYQRQQQQQQQQQQYQRQHGTHYQPQQQQQQGGSRWDSSRREGMWSRDSRRPGGADDGGSGGRGSGGGRGSSSGGGGGGYGRGYFGGSRPGAPYNTSDSRQYQGGPQLQPLNVAERDMISKVSGGADSYQLAVPAQFPVGSVPAQRPGHGSLGSAVKLLVNMYQLEVGNGQLLHYDVTFEKKVTRGRKANPAGGPAAAGPSSSAAAAAAAAAAAGAGPPNAKPPDNARDILAHFDRQFWKGQVAWGFDGRRNLVTAAVPPHLPDEEKVPRVFELANVPVPGRDKTISWMVTFTLTKPPIKLATMAPSDKFPRGLLVHLLAKAIRERDSSDLADSLQLFAERRQPLEWALKELLLARHAEGLGLGQALDAVNEVGRALYFTRNPANRNIGGGLGAMAGLISGVKLTEEGLMFTADATCSAFLRTDIDLVQWMADLAGFNLREQSGGGFGGGRGGGGGGRNLPQVGPPDVDRLIRELQQGSRDAQRTRLMAKLNRAIKNKKVVYNDPSGRTYKYTAAGFTAEPASHAFFFCAKRKDKQQQQQQQEGQLVEGVEMSVAEYFGNVRQHPLRYPGLPVVMMKVPKSAKMDKLWVPPELLRFDKGQRTSAVTHKGGTEQMIEAARKDPKELAEAIDSAVNPRSAAAAAAAAAAGSSSSSSSGAKAPADLLRGLGIKLSPRMLDVQGRILPGPWLVYKDAAAGSSSSSSSVGELKALNTGTSGQWNMNRFQFSDPAELLSWGLLAVLPQQEFSKNTAGDYSIEVWVRDLVRRMLDLGMGLGPDSHQLGDRLMQNIVWLPEHASMLQLQAGLSEAQKRAAKATGRDCQLVLCFIRDKPSALYNDIKIAAELAASQEEQKTLNRMQLGLITQVVVATRTDLGRPRNPNQTLNRNRRSQYQANLCMKINAKCGGINTRWAVQVEQLLVNYFQQPQVPSLMVFGIDLTHPGNREGSRSVAALVGSIDRAFCRYAHRVWEESVAGSEGLTQAKLSEALKALLVAHSAANQGVKPGCLVVYRDGVSDSELLVVRRSELEAIQQACAELPGDGGPGTYRPRVVYVIVQKRHNIRLLKNTAPHPQNLDPGTVVDSGIVSPYLFDFYLNSHKPLIGTSRAARYVCLLDELGFGADALQVFTYWLCYLYCRCARSVSVVAPVYYAHLLAYRARILAGDADDGRAASISSGSSGGGASLRMPEFRKYAEQLDGKMFFV